jgi:hypothetical protein
MIDYSTQFADLRSWKLTSFLKNYQHQSALPVRQSITIRSSLRVSLAIVRATDRQSDSDYRVAA